MSAKDCVSQLNDFCLKFVCNFVWLIQLLLWSTQMLICRQVFKYDQMSVGQMAGSESITAKDCVSQLNDFRLKAVQTRVVDSITALVNANVKLWISL
jgi:hypothetical protein